MSSMNQTRGVIESLFLNAGFGVPIATPSNPFDQQTTSPYMALTVSVVQRSRITVGRGVWRVLGAVIVQCFATVDQSITSAFRDQSGALSLCDMVAKLLDDEGIDGVSFENVKVVDVGTDGSFYQVNLSCSFWRDEVEI